MKTIPRDEYRAQLNRFIEDHGGPQGSGFFGRWAHHSQMERRFREETGFVPYWPPSSAKPSSFREFIRKGDRPESE